MRTAISAPEPPEEPKKPLTEEEMIAAYKIFRKKTLTDAATVFSLPRVRLKNVLVNAVNAG
jgi:hypothetical protein